MTFKWSWAFKPITAENTERETVLSHLEVGITGSYLDRGVGEGCWVCALCRELNGAATAPQPLPGLCWRSFFRCSLGRLGAAAAAAEPAPQHTVRPQSPPSGLLLLAATALSPTLGLRTAASAATRPPCTFHGGARRSREVEKSNLVVGRICQQLQPREACQANFLLLLQSDVAVKTLVLVTAFADNHRRP